MKLLVPLFCIFSCLASAAAPTPEAPLAIIEKYCLDCHDAETEKGDVNLEHAVIDWAAASSRKIWEHALRESEEKRMPPEDKPQPTAKERATLAAWLDEALLQHTPIGGTPPRRLSNAEYQTTIRNLFHLKDFHLPVGFPPDTKLHGFNNQGEGLVLSPPLLEAYSKVATLVADELYPPPKSAPPSVVRTAKPDDLVLSFSAAAIRGNALRLSNSSKEIMRSCTWPSRIEITTSGIYRISVDSAAFKPLARNLMDGPMILEVRAREIAASNRSAYSTFRLLREIIVDHAEPKTTTFEAELYEGQTVMFRWANAPLDHNPTKLGPHAEARFAKDPRLLAAWQQLVFGPAGTKKRNLTPIRGGIGAGRIKKHLANPELDMRDATMNSERTKALVRVFSSNTEFYNVGDAFCYDYFDNGPSLEIHSLRVEGPLSLVASPKDKARANLRNSIFGNRSAEETDEAYLRRVLPQFLSRAFRRPVDQQTTFSFLRTAKRHWQAGHAYDASMHVFIRSLLVSPRFLYRNLNPAVADDFDLANRLAYFLTQAPPDDKLRGLAASGTLSDPAVLKAETLRLLPQKPSAPMIQSFTGQWLGIDRLDQIMPAPEFNFSQEDTAVARREVEYAFSEILRKNRPITDFINPDFTYSTKRFANKIYRIKLAEEKTNGKKKNKQTSMQRIALKRGERHAGLLGQSAVMMATANGVDTQPVLRGVWVLENILGMPTPEPPKDVPALTPDVRGATTPRELLAKHTADARCAACHKSIDPLGFVLENFDPVGRWRTTWPGVNKTIDTTAILPDGTKINDVVELKSWLIQNPDPFALCLADKLMTYATGRKPNYVERNELKSIVKTNRANGNGFQDLLTTLVLSKTFRTK